MRLLLIQRGAADFFRHCSLLHDYCSYPLGTSPLSLSLPLSLSGSLSLAVYPLLGHSLSLSLSPFPLLPLFFLYLTLVQVSSPCPPPSQPHLTASPFGCSACTEAELLLLVFQEAHHKLTVRLHLLLHQRPVQSSPPRALGHVPE